MNGYEVDVAKGQDFIAWAVGTFVGNAHISFEGMFSPEAFDSIPASSIEPNGILKRNTLQPKANFLVLPLEEETKEVIAKSVLPRIGLRRNVYHIQIEKEGQLVLGAYDNLQHCWITTSVHQDKLESLKKSGVIESFREHQRAT
jgi:hypothetical protein